MSTAVEQINEWAALANNATHGPWVAHDVSGGGADVEAGWSGAADWSGPIDDRERISPQIWKPDAAFIAASRTAVPAMAEALTAALNEAYCTDGDCDGHCPGCRVFHAITAALGVTA